MGIIIGGKNVCFIFSDSCICCQELRDWSVEAFEAAVIDGTIGKDFAHCSWCLEKFHAVSCVSNEKIVQP
jgi:hypothetical protein